MEPTKLFLVMMHLILLPVVFQVLKYIRVEEIFKRSTPPNIITIAYIFLTIAITQLVIAYFTTVFNLIDAVF